MSSDTAVWLDGQPTMSLPLPDRGLEFGDGVFETLLLKSGRCLFVDAHLERLQRGLQVLNIVLPEQSLREALKPVASHCSDVPWAALRLTVTRGAAQRGYTPPATDATLPRIITQVSPLLRDCAQLSDAATLAAPRLKLSSQPVLAGIKHLNRLEQVLAAQQVRALACDEGLMLDQDDQVVSVIAGNLFLVHGSKIYTPPLGSSGVSGTRRKLLMERWAPQSGLEVYEKPMALSDVLASDEVFYTNALFGLRPVAQFDNRLWPSHAVTELLFDCYVRDIEGNLS